MNKYIYCSMFFVSSISFGYTFAAYVFLPFLEEKVLENTSLLCILFLLICIFLNIIRGIGLNMKYQNIFMSFIPVFGFRFLRKLYLGN